MEAKYPYARLGKGLRYYDDEGHRLGIVALHHWQQREKGILVWLSTGFGKDFRMGRTRRSRREETANPSNQGSQG